MLKNYEAIKQWLESADIQCYTIKPHYQHEFVVDVDTHVRLMNKKLKTIPVQFGVVNGNFWCNQNELTSLRGSPLQLNGNLNAHINNLTSLEYCPQIVKSINVSENQIISLKGIPQTINGTLIIKDNQITALEFLPKGINSLDCHNNPIVHFSYQDMDIKNRLICTHQTPIMPLHKYYDNDVLDIAFPTLIEYFKRKELSEKLLNELHHKETKKVKFKI